MQTYHNIMDYIPLYLFRPSPDPLPSGNHPSALPFYESACLFLNALLAPHFLWVEHPHGIQHCPSVSALSLEGAVLHNSARDRYHSVLLAPPPSLSRRGHPFCVQASGYAK